MEEIEVDLLSPRPPQGFLNGSRDSCGRFVGVASLLCNWMDIAAKFGGDYDIGAIAHHAAEHFL